MLTMPRDRSTVDSLQELLIELFRARDKLYAAADALVDEDDCYICRRLGCQMGGNAADLQQIVSASGVQPSEPQSEHELRESLPSIRLQVGPTGVLSTAEHTEIMLSKKYEQSMRHLDDLEVTGLLDKQREDAEFADRVLRRLKASHV